jgi:hypothetical protein
MARYAQRDTNLSPLTYQFVADGDNLADRMSEYYKSLVAIRQEAKNRPNIDWQGKIHMGILRGLRNISEAP